MCRQFDRLEAESSIGNERLGDERRQALLSIPGGIKGKVRTGAGHPGLVPAHASMPLLLDSFGF